MSGATAQLAVTGLGALTAVGANAGQSCASIRAGLSGFARHAFYRALPRDGDEPEPLVAAPVRTVEPRLPGPERLLSLLVPVLAEVIASGGLERGALGEAALLLSLPEGDPAVDAWGIEHTFLPELWRRTGAQPAELVVSRAGHAGMLELCGQAGAFAAAGRPCIVAGVDSYLTAERLRHVDEGHRLKSRRGVDGFCPGEAASAFLLEAPRAARARRATTYGTIDAVGVGKEPETVRGPNPSSGQGLAAALEPVIAETNPWVACDLNGESYRAFEWGLVLARLGEQLGEPAGLQHPAVSLGDVGAASGGVLVASALSAMRRGYAPRDHALLWASSDGGARAALRVAGA